VNSLRAGQFREGRVHTGIIGEVTGRTT